MSVSCICFDLHVVSCFFSERAEYDVTVGGIAVTRCPTKALKFKSKIKSHCL